MAAPNFAATPSKDAWRPSSTLQSTGHLGMLRTMANFDNLPSNFSGEIAGLVLFGFATISSKSGIDQLLTNGSLWRPTRRLSLLSPPLLYAPLDPKL